MHLCCKKGAFSAQDTRTLRDKQGNTFTSPLTRARENVWLTLRVGRHKLKRAKQWRITWSKSSPSQEYHSGVYDMSGSVPSFASMEQLTEAVMLGTSPCMLGTEAAMPPVPTEHVLTMWAGSCAAK